MCRLSQSQGETISRTRGGRNTRSEGEDPEQPDTSITRSWSETREDDQRSFSSFLDSDARTAVWEFNHTAVRLLLVIFVSFNLLDASNRGPDLLENSHVNIL